ncbi:MAG: hypothetical protein AAGD86_11765 [Pseudomonadota bacterium]
MSVDDDGRASGADGPRRPLLIAADDGIDSAIALARASVDDARVQPLVLLGTTDRFAFKPRPSTLLVPGMPADAIATLPLLENLGVPVRLASLRSSPGCFEGTVIDLAANWLESLSAREREAVEIVAVGDGALAEAAAALARRVGVPARVSRS